MIQAIARAGAGLSKGASRTFASVKNSFKGMGNKEVIGDFINDYESLDLNNLENKNPLEDIAKNVTFEATEKTEEKEENEPKEKMIPNALKKGMNLPRKLLTLPRVGGIALLLFIILFIVFAIRKVEGTEETRASLLFKTFTGDASVDNFGYEEEEGEDEDSFNPLDLLPGVPGSFIGADIGSRIGGLIGGN